METRGTCFTEHRHKCSSCGVIFQHDPREFDEKSGLSEAHVHSAAHQCPSCGKDQYVIYQGKDQAVCRNNGIIPQWTPQPLPPVNSAEELAEDDEDSAERMVRCFLTMSPKKRIEALAFLELTLKLSPEVAPLAKLVKAKLAALNLGPGNKVLDKCLVSK